MTTPGEPPVPLETVGERYVLVGLVEADARREIWRGHDDLASRPVAVTRYLQPTDEWRRRFDQRARALEALSDPGIASILRHDADDDLPWLVTAWVDGETVNALDADGGFSVDDALATVGQAAFALAAARDAGIGHGRIDADHILVRPDGSVALIGFATDSTPAPDADLPALGRVATALIAVDSPLDPEVATFLAALCGDSGARPTDPADVGRTALALASAHRTKPGSGAVERRDQPAPSAKEAATPGQRWYDDEERKRVRNRLIALGAIVVIGGAVLLRILNSGAGQATVPSVVGLPYVQAQHQLNEVGFRASETLTTGPAGSVGTVIAQDPPGGTRAKVGTLVHLTVATAER